MDKADWRWAVAALLTALVTGSPAPAHDSEHPIEHKQRDALCARADAALVRIVDREGAQGLVQIGATFATELNCMNLVQTCGRVEQGMRKHLDDQKPFHEVAAILGLFQNLGCPMVPLLEILEERAD